MELLSWQVVRVVLHMKWRHFKKLTQGNKPESHVSYGNYTRCEYNKKLRFAMLLHFSEGN